MDKNKKWKKFWLRIPVTLIWIIAMVALIILKIFTSDDLFFDFLLLCALIATFVCDDSGIRFSLMKHVSKDFPFYKELRKRRKVSDKLTEYCKTITCFTLIVMLLFPVTTYFTLAITIIFPVIAIVQYITHDHINFADKNKDRLSPTALSLLIPGFVFTLAVIDDHEYNTLFWIIWILTILTCMIPFFVYTTEYKKKISVVLGYGFTVAIFTFGAINMVNMVYDYNEPTEYEVRVIDKEYISGKSGGYYVTVSPWDHQMENVQFGISSDEYDCIQIGEKVTVVQSEGALKMKWYYLEI